jgi:hypothetical protein
MSENSESPASIDLAEVQDAELVGAFVKLRDKRAERKKEWETKDTQYAERLESIQAELLKRQTDRGIDQIKVTGVGTAFKSKTMVASCADWPVFFDWCIKEIDKTRAAGGDPSEVFAFFQKRLTIDTVKSFMERNEGGVPPAVNALTKYAINVRRSTS